MTTLTAAAPQQAKTKPTINRTPRISLCVLNKPYDRDFCNVIDRLLNEYNADIISGKGNTIIVSNIPANLLETNPEWCIVNVIGKTPIWSFTYKPLAPRFLSEVILKLEKYCGYKFSAYYIKFSTIVDYLMNIEEIVGYLTMERAVNIAKQICREVKQPYNILNTRNKASILYRQGPAEELVKLDALFSKHITIPIHVEEVVNHEKVTNHISDERYTTIYLSKEKGGDPIPSINSFLEHAKQLHEQYYTRWHYVGGYRTIGIHKTKDYIVIGFNHDIAYMSLANQLELMSMFYGITALTLKANSNQLILEMLKVVQHYKINNLSEVVETQAALSIVRESTRKNQLLKELSETEQNIMKFKEEKEQVIEMRNKILQDLSNFSERGDMRITNLGLMDDSVLIIEIETAPTLIRASTSSTIYKYLPSYHILIPINLLSFRDYERINIDFPFLVHLAPKHLDFMNIFGQVHPHISPTAFTSPAIVTRVYNTMGYTYSKFRGPCVGTFHNEIYFTKNLTDIYGTLDVTMRWLKVYNPRDNWGIRGSSLFEPSAVTIDDKKLDVKPELATIELQEAYKKGIESVEYTSESVKIKTTV